MRTHATRTYLHSDRRVQIHSPKQCFLLLQMTLNEDYMCCACLYFVFYTYSTFYILHVILHSTFYMLFYILHVILHSTFYSTFYMLFYILHSTCETRTSRLYIVLLHRIRFTTLKQCAHMQQGDILHHDITDNRSIPRTTPPAAPPAPPPPPDEVSEDYMCCGCVSLILNHCTDV